MQSREYRPGSGSKGIDVKNVAFKITAEAVPVVDGHIVPLFSSLPNLLRRSSDRTITLVELFFVVVILHMHSCGLPFNAPPCEPRGIARNIVEGHRNNTKPGIEELVRGIDKISIGFAETGQEFVVTGVDR